MRALTLPATLALALFARSAAAQTPAVEAEHQRGMQLRAEGRDADAVAVFRALFERTGEPRALARLGLAEAALQRWIDADEHLRGALARATDPWVSTNRAGLEAAHRVVRGHLGFVTVSCEVPGAVVQVGADAPTALPMREPRRVVAGFVDIAVRAPGHASATRRVAVSAGDEPVAVSLTLEPEAPAAPAQPPAPQAPAVIERPRAPAPPVAAPRPSRAGRTVAIALFAGAGAALGVGVAGLILREGAASRFNDAGCRLYPDRDELSSGAGACANELSSAQTFEGMSIAGLVAAGVLGAAGATTWLLSPRVEVTPQALRASVVVTF